MNYYHDLIKRLNELVNSHYVAYSHPAYRYVMQILDDSTNEAVTEDAERCVARLKVWLDAAVKAGLYNVTIQFGSDINPKAMCYPLHHLVAPKDPEGFFGKYGKFQHGVVLYHDAFFDDGLRKKRMEENAKLGFKRTSYKKSVSLPCLTMFGVSARLIATPDNSHNASDKPTRRLN